MKNCEFFKYHGAGNDFILLDNRQDEINLEPIDISKLCDRHFGIGADGLMLLRKHAEYAFEMVYFNSDGKPSSMCGNGGRCISKFAHQLGMFQEECEFIAVDGLHQVKIIDENTVSLLMSEVRNIEKVSHDEYILDTGSPHYIKFVDDVEDIELLNEARSIRYSNRFKEMGINVNFVMIEEDRLKVRTYERGVEDETLACGTGVTAAAIAAHFKGSIGDKINVKTRGGNLSVSFRENQGHYYNIWKTGPVKFVFKGIVQL